MSIGSNIKFYRKNQNLTQKELATIVEVTDATINRYEQGQREPNLQMINKIAEALNVCANDLIADENTIDITSISSEGLNILYDDELIALTEIFKMLGYKLTESESCISIFKGDNILSVIPEKYFIEAGKEMLSHINEFSEFEINKFINGYKVFD